MGDLLPWVDSLGSELRFLLHGAPETEEEGAPSRAAFSAETFLSGLCSTAVPGGEAPPPASKVPDSEELEKPQVGFQGRG